MIRIEDDIPAPPAPAKGRAGPAREFALALPSMRSGQSVVFDKESQMKSATLYARAMGIEVTARKERGGWRVWKK